MGAVVRGLIPRLTDGAGGSPSVTEHTNDVIASLYCILSQSRDLTLAWCFCAVALYALEGNHWTHA
jgi:hypothetical protein